MSPQKFYLAWILSQDAEGYTLPRNKFQDLDNLHSKDPKGFSRKSQGKILGQELCKDSSVRTEGSGSETEIIDHLINLAL